MVELVDFSTATMDLQFIALKKPNHYRNPNSLAQPNEERNLMLIGQNNVIAASWTIIPYTLKFVS